MPRFTPEFLDELKSRLRPSDVIGRYVKLKKQGNEWAGLSPFSKEKTPSFFVNDQKGFYHCFSSGKHGDIIGFLQETQNLSFMEAVTQLAQDAGLELPKGDQQEAKREEARKGLVDVCEAAAGFFAAMLKRHPGSAARNYLQHRGITTQQIEAFRMGYAPSERHALKDYLIGKGFSEAMIGEAGLLTRPDDGKPSFDKFRDRVIFPITDQRGRVIAFGGRALSKEVRAKYLNSPETPLFHKGATLYRYREARAAAATGKSSLIVCEGYMDVIALWGAGLGQAVAPLGTALTETQLSLLWRACDEPVLCFDGDHAGIGAAYRAVERALPLLKPGKSLNFVFLPDGKDPDDLLREEGRGALDEMLKAPKPLVDVVWQREQEETDLSTPERRAAFRTRLRSLIRTIVDKDVQAAYGREIAIRLDEMFAPVAHNPASHNNSNPFRGGQAGSGRYSTFHRLAKGNRGHLRGWQPPVQLSVELRRKLSGVKGAALEEAWACEGSLILVLLRDPGLIERHEADILDLGLTVPELSDLLNDILGLFSTSDDLDITALKRHFHGKATGKTLERLLTDNALNRQPFLRAEAQPEDVDRGFENLLACHLYQNDLKKELSRSSAHLFSASGLEQKSMNGEADELSSTGVDHAAEDDETTEAPAWGEGYWKALALAREEQFQKSRLTAQNDQQSEKESDRLEKVLDSLGNSVAKVTRKRDH